MNIPPHITFERMVCYGFHKKQTTDFTVNGSLNAVVAGPLENAAREFYTERASRGTSQYTIGFYSAS